MSARSAIVSISPEERRRKLDSLVEAGILSPKEAEEIFARVPSDRVLARGHLAIEKLKSGSSGSAEGQPD